MPLSEHEERILAEIERQLAEDDPRFALRSRRLLASWGSVHRLRLAGALGIVGLVLVAALTFDIVFGAIGMMLLLLAVLVGARGIAARAREESRPRPPDERG